MVIKKDGTRKIIALLAIMALLVSSSIALAQGDGDNQLETQVNEIEEEIEEEEEEEEIEEEEEEEIDKDELDGDELDEDVFVILSNGEGLSIEVRITGYPHEAQVGQQITVKYEVENTSNGNSGLYEVSINDSFGNNDTIGTFSKGAIKYYEQNYTIKDTDGPTLTFSVEAKGYRNKNKVGKIVEDSTEVYITIIQATEPTGSIRVIKTMSDEASPENIPFTLTKAEGGQEWTLETDADGIILFEELEPGVYTLVEDVPEGYLTSLDETNNTITVTASDDPVEVLVTNEKINPSITVTKIAEPETVTVGDPITYRYTVTNDGNVTLTEVTLVDDMFQDPIELSVEERDWDGTLEPGEIAEGEAEYVADKVGILTNTATATGYYNGTAYSGTDTVGVEVLEGPPEPGIKITKDADKEWAKKGEWIKYTMKSKIPAMLACGL